MLAIGLLYLIMHCTKCSTNLRFKCVQERENETLLKTSNIKCVADQLLHGYVKHKCSKIVQKLFV